MEPFKVYRGVLLLEGDIVAGDYEKLRNFLADRPTFDKITGGVFVASRGGNLAEAMRIGHLIRTLRLSTSAPNGPPVVGRKFGEALIGPETLRHPRENYVCASACFLVFVAGIYRNLNWAGRLGIHKPFQRQIDLKKLDNLDQAEIDKRIHRAIEIYLRNMNVRIKYVDIMFSVPSTTIRWITQAELESDLQGFIPDLKDEIDAKCAGDRPVTGQGTTSADFAKCQVRVRAELRADQPAQAWAKVYGGK